PPPPRSTLFPYTTLFRSQGLDLRQVPVDPRAYRPGRHRLLQGGPEPPEEDCCQAAEGRQVPAGRPVVPCSDRRSGNVPDGGRDEDRKSTRLNSSHVEISY